MTANSYAIKLARTKRKKRKPPRWTFWLALLYVAMELFLIIICLGRLANPEFMSTNPEPDTLDPFWYVLIALVTLIQLFALPGFWYWLIYEIELWKKMNDD